MLLTPGVALKPALLVILRVKSAQMAILGAWARWHPPVSRHGQAATEGHGLESPRRPPAPSEMNSPVDADAADEFLLLPKFIPR
jgi:hypothetical protein